MNSVTEGDVKTEVKNRQRTEIKKDREQKMIDRKKRTHTNIRMDSLEDKEIDRARLTKERRR
jgi:hypothetical protein